MHLKESCHGFERQPLRCAGVLHTVYWIIQCFRARAGLFLLFDNLLYREQDALLT